MLQSAPQQPARSSLESRYESPDQGLDIWSYVAILKRRKLLLILPFILVLTVGFVVTLALPPVFRSEARILVESQQIPTELDPVLLKFFLLPGNLAAYSRLSSDPAGCLQTSGSNCRQ